MEARRFVEMGNGGYGGNVGDGMKFLRHDVVFVGSRTSSPSFKFMCRC